MLSAANHIDWSTMRGGWDENDDKERNCKITVITMPIYGPFSHEAVYFEWEDYCVIYEADEQDGILTPNCIKGRLTNEWTRGRMYERKCSPKQVNQRAKTNSFNFKIYSLISPNCKDWTKELVGCFA